MDAILAISSESEDSNRRVDGNIPLSNQVEREAKEVKKDEGLTIVTFRQPPPQPPQNDLEANLGFPMAFTKIPTSTNADK